MPRQDIGTPTISAGLNRALSIQRACGQPDKITTVATTVASGFKSADRHVFVFFETAILIHFKVPNFLEAPIRGLLFDLAFSLSELSGMTSKRSSRNA